jgi:hypothetical protein
MAGNGRKTELVDVSKVAEAFRLSERQVQRLVIYEHMPRESRGEYDLTQCLEWYCNFLHRRLCGCAGPCDGFDVVSRNGTNARAERQKALREIAVLAPELVGLKAKAIEKVLAKAIEDVYAERG